MIATTHPITVNTDDNTVTIPSAHMQHVVLLCWPGNTKEVNWFLRSMNGLTMGTPSVTITLRQWAWLRGLYEDAKLYGKPRSKWDDKPSMSTQRTTNHKWRKLRDKAPTTA